MVGFTAVGLQAVGLGVVTQGGLVPPADTTPPTFAGPIALSAITTTGAHAAWPAGADNVAVAGYEISVDTGTPLWVDLGNVLACDISGKIPGTDYTVRLRAYDGATPHNYSAPITAPLRTEDPVALPPDGSAPPPVPTTADIHVFTIMRVSTVNLKTQLGPAAINLTVSLT